MMLKRISGLLLGSSLLLSGCSQNPRFEVDRDNNWYPYASGETPQATVHVVLTNQPIFDSWFSSHPFWVCETVNGEPTIHWTSPNRSFKPEDMRLGVRNSGKVTTVYFIVGVAEDMKIDEFQTCVDTLQRDYVALNDPRPLVILAGIARRYPTPPTSRHAASRP